MKYSEVLEKTRLVEGFLREEIRLAIVKESNDGIAELKESRKLSKQECMQYTRALIDYLLNNNISSIVLPDSKIAYSFYKKDLTDNEFNELIKGKGGTE